MMSVSRFLLHVTAVLLFLGLTGGCSPPASPGETPVPTGTPSTTPTETPTLTAPAPTDTPTPTATATVRPTSTSTTTPTPAPPQAASATATPEQKSRCPGLAGELEVQILAGPAAAVGLEPFGVGRVPISVSSAGPPYPVSGGGNITFADMLTEQWGTYAVDMNLDLDVSGSCSGPAGAEQLDLTVGLSGSQLVTVDAMGFHGEYPWNGSQSLQVALPLVNGASAAGEGWGFVLQLNP